MSKLQLLIKNRRRKKISAVSFFLQFFVIKALDPDPNSLEMLDNDRNKKK
jgi:hypothetical protein